MPLFHLVYVSKATQPFSIAELRELVDKAAWKNKEQDITGILLYSAGNFIQVLEGECEQLEILLARIARDPRHINVERLLREPITERSFSYWGMRLLDLSAAAEVDLPRLRSLEHKVTGNAAARTVPAMMGYLRDFCAQLPTTVPQTAGSDLISNIPE